MSLLIENMTAARKSGVPLLAVATQDQPATVEAICNNVPGLNESPQIAWDCLNGLRPINAEGKRVLATDFSEKALAESANPVLALKMAYTIAPKSIIFLYNIHAFLQQPGVVQGIQNCREAYKENKRTLVGLAPSFTDMRQELQADVVTLEEPLPTDTQLTTLITDLHESADKKLDKAKLPGMIDAVRGLPALFTVEQVVAMSFRKEGLDMGALWDRKVAAINATKGLTISRGVTSYADLAGMDVIMDFLRSWQSGPRPFRLVLFWDEIEKMMQGASGEADSSGVSSDYLQVVLKIMERLRWAGVILLGPGGSGKTALAEATAREFDVPMITQDFGAMKGRYVGDSEGAVRQAFKVVEGIGGRDVLVMATCNKLRTLPPEFRRRFWLGNWYFDIPTLKEQEPIKRIYEKKYALSSVHGDWPDTTGWTGSEIRNCAELAVSLRGKNGKPLTLVRAAEYIVPIAKAAPEDLKALRDVAQSRFLSVAYPGTYMMPEERERSEKGGKSVRKLDVN